MRESRYTAADLTKEAKRAVKGKGKYVGWVLVLAADRPGCFLWAKYKGKTEGGAELDGSVAVAI